MRIALFFVLLLTLPCLAQEPVAKAKVPDEAAQKSALAVIADVYKPDYEKAKTPALKIELSKKLLGEAVATKDDPVNRFVLFRVARDIAAQQGEITTAFDAIGRINAEYEADALQMKLDAATLAVKALKTPKDHQACVGILASLNDEAVVADRYDLAKALAALTLGCAREGRDADRIKQMTAKSKEIDEIASEFEKVREAKGTLDAKPTDPAANFAVGKFLCFVKGDWRRGVTMLALGDNEEFKAAALLELESQPDSLKAGDVWWKIAEGLEATAKSKAQVHAGEWYRKALPGLGGLTKTRVERQLEAVSKQITSTPVNLLDRIDLKADVRRGTWRLSEGVLITPIEEGELECPYAFPEHYDLTLVVERKNDGLQPSKEGDALRILGLPVGKRRINVFIDAGLRASGVVDTEKYEWPAEKTTLMRNRPATVVYQVRGTDIQVYCDGKKLFDWSTSKSSQSPNGSGQFSIGSNHTVFHITKIIVVKK
jgi:hypothetical protein